MDVYKVIMLRSSFRVVQIFVLWVCDGAILQSYDFTDIFPKRWKATNAAAFLQAETLNWCMGAGGCTFMKLLHRNPAVQLDLQPLRGNRDLHTNTIDTDVGHYIVKNLYFFTVLKLHFNLVL